MKAVIAAGGTAGHINPAIAIADKIKMMEPDSQIVFVGRDDGMEKRLVAEAGYDFHPIEIHGFSRSLKPSEILFNIKSVRCAALAMKKARSLFEKFGPDIVIGCGGYVSGPVVKTAYRMGIKTAIHEQNSFPGVTTRMLSRGVDVIFAANSDIIPRLKHGDKCVVTGNPVREAFFEMNREEACADINPDGKVCVISFGGSLGAGEINEVAAQFIKLHHKTGEIIHYHATGQYATRSFPERLKELGIDYENNGNIIITDYIRNMPRYLSAADLVLSRSGALTISEIAASGTASLLIPSPNVAENHQYYNALTLADRNAAVLVEEKEKSPEEIAKILYDLCRDPEKLKKMGENASTAEIKETADIIYGKINELLGRR